MSHSRRQVKNRIARWVAISLLTLPSIPGFAEPSEQQQDESWGWKAAVITSIAMTMATNPLNARTGGMSLMAANDVAGLKMMFRWQPKDSMGQWGPFNISHYYHLAYSKWQSTTDSTQVGANNVLEFVPVFRLAWQPTGVVSYVETAIGAALFSRTQLNDRNFGSNFQFTDTMAIGGKSDRWDWSLQFQHYSNNSIELPNNGINFYNFNLVYRY